MSGLMRSNIRSSRGSGFSACVYGGEWLLLNFFSLLLIWCCFAWESVKFLINSSVLSG